MIQAERIIAAYHCSEGKLPGKRCQYCPFEYGYLNDSGDHPFWTCNDEAIMKDAVEIISLLVGPRRTSELKNIVGGYLDGSR